LIEENLILDNESRGGGGVMLGAGSPVLRNNSIMNNRSQYDGGGVFIWLNVDHVTITGNEFVENEAGDHGGGITCWNGEPFGGQARVDITSNLRKKHREGRGLGE
jgi:hypothetical protein